MSNLDQTEVWVLRAKVEVYEKALAESMQYAHDVSEESVALAESLHLLREGVRGFALTLRAWAVAAGGHTPSAIIASRLLELIGDEKPAYVETEADVAAKEVR